MARSPYESLWHRLTERCSDAGGECWIGIDPADRFGYQRIDVWVPGLAEKGAPRALNMGRRRLMAHIVAYCWQAWSCSNTNELWLAYCELRASGLELDHDCSTPGCRNPAHLTPRTPHEHRQVTRDRRQPRPNIAHDPADVEF